MKQDGKKLCNILVCLVTSFCLHQSWIFGSDSTRFKLQTIRSP